MSSSEPTIRQADRADLAKVHQLLVTTWHDTYDPLIGPEKVTEITDAWHSVEALTGQLEMPSTSFLVAEHRGMIVGHLFANAQHLPILELSRLYVLPDFQRRGIGAKLVTAALLRHPDAEVMRLAVEADNRKGLSFYRREGFEPVGSYCEAGIEHIRMERRVAHPR